MQFIFSRVFVFWSKWEKSTQTGRDLFKQSELQPDWNCQNNIYLRWKWPVIWCEASRERGDIAVKYWNINYKLAKCQLDQKLLISWRNRASPSSSSPLHQPQPIPLLEREYSRHNYRQHKTPTSVTVCLVNQFSQWNVVALIGNFLILMQTTNRQRQNFSNQMKLFPQ